MMPLMLSTNILRLTFCVFGIRLISNFPPFFRTSRSRGTKEGRTSSEPHHQLAQRSRDLQSGRAEEGPTIFLQDPGPTPDPEVAQRPGAPEDLLPQAGGSRSGAATHREDVRLQHPLLKG